MTTDRDCADTVRDDAAAWFALTSDRPLDAGEQARFDEWRARSPRHTEEYRALQQIWGAADQLSKERLQALLREDSPTSLPRKTAVLRYAVAASVVAVAVSAALWFGLNTANDYSGQFATAFGERKQVTLPDGSVVDLNSRTRMEVHFVRGQRQVLLSEGEAMFSVQHDASRPFVVEAGKGRVTVTGTRFDVRRDPAQTLIAVESGTVKVDGSENSGDTVVLTAGLGSRVDGSGRVSPASAVNTAAIIAWRTGKLVFNDAPLSEVVEEVSRYRQRPLMVASGKTANLRLTSVFKADDTDALLRALPSILPVTVRTLGDGSQEIISR
jgi:transmembrane sensor